VISLYPEKSCRSDAFVQRSVGADETFWLAARSAGGGGRALAELVAEGLSPKERPSSWALYLHDNPQVYGEKK